MKLLFHWHHRMPFAMALLFVGVLGLLAADRAAKVAGSSVPQVTTAALSRTVVVQSVPPPEPAVFPDALPCRKNPFSTLQHNPSMFTLLSPCQTASGRVAQVFRNKDGDIHVHIFPDDSSKPLLNDTNREQIFGLLVLEVTPKDQKIVLIPKVGDRIEAVGAWVTDKYHEWNELHPVWGIRVLSP